MLCRKDKRKVLQPGDRRVFKRLSKYCKLEIKEAADEKTPDSASDTVNRMIKEKEGDRLLSFIKDDSYVIALAIDGKMLDSVELSEKIDNLMLSGKSDYCFCYRWFYLGLIREC